MNLKTKIKELFTLCQELEEIAVNDDFLQLVRDIDAESDPEEEYNIDDVQSFINDIHYAINNGYETMHGFYDDY